MFGQPAPPPPAFEVASVKPSLPQPVGQYRASLGGDASRVSYTGMSLKNVMTRAYGVKYYQITGPSWLESELYDIAAKVPDGVPKEQIPAMLQALLAERFQMTVHRETREQPVYALVVGKSGPKLKKYEDSAPPAPGVPGGMAPRSTGAGAASIPMSRGSVNFRIGGGEVSSLEARGTTLSGLAGILSNMMDRPVLDMTGIQGYYDITLEAAAGELGGARLMGPAGAAATLEGSAGTAPAPAPESAPSASIFTSIQQLGLRLEPRKGPVEYIVVDKAEKVPTEN
jgi:uncharacterized protein (TIGR03435 family)